MSIKKSIVITMLFNFMVEYLGTPVAIAYPLWFVFFPTFSLGLTCLLAVWFRLTLELFIKLVAGVWYAEKYSRQK